MAAIFSDLDSLGSDAGVSVRKEPGSGIVAKSGWFETGNLILQLLNVRRILYQH